MRTLVGRHRGARVLATLIAAAAMASAPGAPAGASPVLAAGTYDSAAITLTFTGNRTGSDATRIVVYPALTVRTPQFYPVGAAGVTDGCSSGATSPNPGVSFGSVSYNAATNVTTMVVTVQNVMGAGAWAVQIGSGAVSADDPGCLRFAIPEQI